MHFVELFLNKINNLRFTIFYYFSDIQRLPISSKGPNNAPQLHPDPDAELSGTWKVVWKAISGHST